MESINDNPADFNDQIADTIDSINDIVNEVSLFGFNSLDEREIVYGITTAVGIDPVIDNVLEIGSNIGELYFYIERLLGNAPVGYYGVEPDEKFIDICRFRITDGNTEFYNIDIDSVINYLNTNEIDNIKEIMDINVDWGVLINQLNNMEPSEIVSMLELFIKIPNKGVVITNKFSTDKIHGIIDLLLKSESLNRKFIFRSDFLTDWYSIYFYNNR